MITHPLVIERGPAPLTVPELDMRCDAHGVPDPMTGTAESYWSAGAKFLGTAERPGEGPRENISATGVFLLAVLRNRLLGIVFPDGPTGPSLWLSIDRRAEVCITAKGRRGVFRTRPEKIVITADETFLVLEEVNEVLRGSNLHGAKREAKLVSLLQSWQEGTR